MPRSQKLPEAKGQGTFLRPRENIMFSIRTDLNRYLVFVKLREENKRYCSSIAVSIPAGRPCLRFLLHFLRDFQTRLDNKTRFRVIT